MTSTTTTTTCPAWCTSDHASGSVHSATPRVSDDGWSGDKISVGVSLAPHDPHGYTDVCVSIDWRYDGITLTPEAAEKLARDLLAAAKEARA